MDKHAMQNIQDAFLNSARRERLSVVVQLMSGTTLSGQIRSFDKFSILLGVGDEEHLVFKHAISSMSVEKKNNNSR
ncbi:MAG: RNA chaperone Hfq [Pyrinomonadaceae bacterium]